jgi:hypothetical protein
MSNRNTAVVDLTMPGFSSSPPLEPRAPPPAGGGTTAAAGPSRRTRRQSSITSIASDDFRGRKRRRHDNNAPVSIPVTPLVHMHPARRNSRPHCTHPLARPRASEPVDLTEIDDSSALSRTLAKQREDAVKAQAAESSSESGRSILANYKCPVCMDTPVDATTTACGTSCLPVIINNDSFFP